ncbi:PIN-like domain-containing protein [Deinococcus pimensis]|uniref:PIN-like domain-containing protein n=1 Tax=Deinococcus pimensis TaxID=309888 RepID=UPI0004B348F9|nr:PIN domain-containing protein [Deinococcus pimensis]
MSQKKSDPSDESILRLEFVFPDASSIFQIQSKSAEHVKDSCIVVLDTNTLLVPYTVSAESLSNIERTYKHLVASQRLFVPAQAAREFADNRTTKLTELHSNLVKRQQITLNKERYPLLTKFSEYSDLAKAEKDLESAIKEYKLKLSSLEKLVEGWTWNDPVSELYKEIFTSSVVTELTLDRAALLNDLDRRQRLKIPPGYKDASKDSNSAGDLIIWHTILQIGQTLKRDMIFVSSDDKPDWFHRSSGRSLYPRFELVSEYFEKSEGRNFTIVKLSALLQLFGAEEKVVHEVEDKEEHLAVQRQNYLDANDLLSSRSCEGALVKYYGSKYTGYYLAYTHMNTRAPQIVFRGSQDGTNREVGVGYVFIDNLSTPLDDVGNVITTMLRSLWMYEHFDADQSNPRLWPAEVAAVTRQAYAHIVADSSRGARVLASYVRDNISLPPRMSVSVGHLGESGNYIENAHMVDDR